jgi:hypothetical protein
MATFILVPPTGYGDATELVNQPLPGFAVPRVGDTLELKNIFEDGEGQSEGRVVKVKWIFDLWDEGPEHSPDNMHGHTAAVEIYFE